MPTAGKAGKYAKAEERKMAEAVNQEANAAASAASTGRVHRTRLRRAPVLIVQTGAGVLTDGFIAKSSEILWTLGLFAV